MTYYNTFIPCSWAWQSYKVKEGHGRSWKVFSWQFKIWRWWWVTCGIIVSAPVPLSHSPSSFSLDLRLWILDFGLELGHDNIFSSFQIKIILQDFWNKYSTLPRPCQSQKAVSAMIIQVGLAKSDPVLTPNLKILPTKQILFCQTTQVF